MKTKNKILSGLLISAILSTGLLATANMDKKDEKKNDDSTCMMGKGKFHDDEKAQRGKGHFFGIFKELNLTAEQDEKIKKIIEDSRKNEITPDVAFTKDSFDKNKFVSILSEKRDNMIKSEAEIIEKAYAILTAKQKEQLKVLMDLRKEKMGKRL